MTKGCIYYTDSQLDERISRPCREQLRKAFDGEIVAVSLKPLDFGDKRIVLPLERSYLTMFTQILAGLEASTVDIIFHCEHDNLYHPSHFDFTPPDRKFYYDHSWWKIREDGFAVHWDADQVSSLCAHREDLIDFYKQRIATFDPDNFDRKFEPMSGHGSVSWWAKYPSLDIRHNHNLTYNKWGLEHFRDKRTAKNFQESTIDEIPGWSNISSIIKL